MSPTSPEHTAPHPRPAEGNVELATISEPEALAELGESWDALVGAMPRPSPYLRLGWLTAWWKHFSAGRELRVCVASRGGRIVAALPLCLTTRPPLRRLEFVGGRQSALADLMLADGEDRSVAGELALRAAESGQRVAELFGLPGRSRLAAAVPPAELRLVRRLEAPVLDLARGWDAVYVEKTSANRRRLHNRRRRTLAQQGHLAVTVARTLGQLEAALEEAFVLYARRWEGRADASHFATERGRDFERDVLRALAGDDVPRIVTLRLDGRAIAFHYSFVLGTCMYAHKLAFEPAIARHSPGVVNLLDTLAYASDEGIQRFEFLGGGERYKLELADRLEPLYVGLGLTNGSTLGKAAAYGQEGSIRLRLRAKNSPVARRAHERLTPISAVVRRARTGAG
jgi:CelD/BcsL family acetyltransferase involved in cellulose biosynthesis